MITTMALPEPSDVAEPAGVAARGDIVARGDIAERGDVAARGDVAEDADVAKDAHLAATAQSGDRTAFARLYERFAPAVHGVLVATAPVSEAQDLVQDVFLLALRSLGGLEDPRRFGPWLMTIARNRARDALKKQTRMVPMREGFEPVDPAAGAAGTERSDRDDGDEAERALGAIRSLPEAYRETLALRLVEGLSGPEIAARTGLTHGSVRINLHRGMKLLRERLERAAGGGAA
jgi:RNA polymerase sigma-70 factor (ECF subfamily)